MTDSTTGPLRVLVVEDDQRMLEILARHLDRMGYAVRAAEGAVQAMQLLDRSPADVVLADVRMPGMDGRTLMKVARERFPALRVVLMTAFGSVDDAVEAMKSGAYTYVCKPFKVEEIAAVLRGIAQELLVDRVAEPPKRPLCASGSADRLIGTSARMEHVRSVIREAAQVSSTVLITGKSGTGKELTARAIHYESARATAPFVPVNCAAIPETLFESSMFGHRRGAFTGALADQRGFLELAHGGTIFLDEVGEIPLSQQPKLLRALESGEIRPLGSAKPIGVSVRVIAATNRNLESMVARGELREDLYYRLDVLRLELPGLAERPEDIPALAEHLLVEIAIDQGTHALGFTEAALAALQAAKWPGNVRELRNVVERATLSARGRRIDTSDLVFATPTGLRTSAHPTSPEPHGTLSTLADVEKAHVEKVLAACHWNRSAAARVLDIDRRTLFTKIQRYGMVGHLRSGGEQDE